MKVSGTFEVKLAPLDAYAKGGEAMALGRMSIDKTFSGGLSAQSQGEMLSAMNADKSGAGYVAIEHVTGSLDGKAGSFVLQHYGTINAGENFLLLEVVPNSGTDALRGLSGTMAIRIEADQHFYDFDYALD